MLRFESIRNGLHPTMVDALAGLTNIQGLTAAGTTQGTALTLPLVSVATVTTCGVSAGVIVPGSMESGDAMLVTNTTATNALAVYPPLGHTFLYGTAPAANAAVSVAVGKTVLVQRLGPAGSTFWTAFISA